MKPRTGLFAFLALCGKQNDRHVAELPQTLEEREAVHLRHHHVQHHQVRRIELRLVKPGWARFAFPGDVKAAE